MHKTVATAALSPSPLNKRRSLGDLAGLARSLKSVGMLQPIVARETSDGLEVVCGHRRLAAAKKAKIVEVPVDVRKMNDQEALEAQVVENCQREDVHYIEEAEWYSSLVVQCDMRPEDIAHRIGQGKPYVYSRLKLMNLDEKARDFLLQSAVGYSIAGLIARLHPKHQLEAATSVAEQGLSYRDALMEIEGQWTCSLTYLPWTQNNPRLVPEAGACTECPMRAGNDESAEDLPLFFEPTTCLSPACFRSKLDAAWAQKKEKAAKDGIDVFDEKKDVRRFFPYKSASPSSDKFVEMDTECDRDPDRRTYRKLFGAKAADTLVRDPSGKPRLFLARSKIKDLLIQAGVRGVDGAEPKDKPAKKTDRTEPKLMEITDLADSKIRARLCELAQSPCDDLEFMRATASFLVSYIDCDKLITAAGLKKGDENPSAKIDAMIKSKKTTQPVLRSFIAAAAHLENPEAADKTFCEFFEIDRDKLEHEARDEIVAERKSKVRTKKAAS